MDCFLGYESVQHMLSSVEFSKMRKQNQAFILRIMFRFGEK